jgi:hypothetical protein
MHADNSANAANRETLRRKSNCPKEETMTEELPSTVHTTSPILLAIRKNPATLVVNSTRLLKEVST